ncbi:putative nuclease HARBI1 [Ischnura elegans]|uniref:putative nuclease HARBI1 n=1 Tax=Ischnura elegans TaxID=197161 RepID=UPI001ED88FBD|nr:putative nuclease HARBI1 [Ischnura elegans]
MRDEDFRVLFRVSRGLAMDIATELTLRLSRRRSSGLPVHAQVLSVIRFFATGSYQRCVGQDMTLSMGQPSVSRNIAAVTDAFMELFAERFIRFPATFEERQSIKNRFMEMRGFPGVVGCIDCTHIKIVKPTVREEMYFNNHKRCHSLNVQAICDHDLRILAANARYPGSVHDQFIRNASTAKDILQSWNDEGIVNTWLLGMLIMQMLVSMRD